MPHVRTLLAVLALSPYLAQSQPVTEQPAAVGAFAVAYVETEAGKVDAGGAALERYRASTVAQPGCVRVEVFAQVGRPGHFAVIETWRDAAALEQRGQAPQRELLAALESVRVSGYDERPYKTLSVAAAADADAADRRSVYVISHVDVAPNTAAPMLLTKLAEASRKEAGNLRFDVLQHTMRANHFTVVEAWRSEAALDAHVAATHTREFRDALQPLTGSPLDERVYRAIAPR
jgi:quinol monooxygenase YgiN